MDLIIPYLLTGLASGLLAGLFGVGGGLIIVPALIFLFTFQNLPSEIITHLAIGTSLSIVSLTAISSLRAHNRYGTIDWPGWKKLAPGLFIGAFIGAFVAKQFDSHQLKTYFAIFEIVVALYFLCDIRPGRIQFFSTDFILVIAALIIGTMSSLVGIGGGVMVVPLMLAFGLNIKQAVSTSAACGLPIALAGTIGFIFTGLEHSATLPSWSTGYINWPAFFWVGLSSVFLAPVGAKLAHQLPSKVLKRFFAFLLFAIGISLLA